MNPNLTLLLAAIIAGSISGYIAGHEESVESIADQSAGNDANSHHDSFQLSPFAAVSNTDNQQIWEQEIARLQTRINQLENRLNSLQAESHNQHEPTAAAAQTANTGATETLSKDNLVKAGVDENLAAEILRRRSEREYQQLELRDRAIRENYINTPRYFQQLRELNASSVSLREDIGNDAYDRYLYVTGQNNRVVVSSIMSGSPAEQAGLQKGDIIVRYDNEKIFNWHDARQATTEGSRNEYITLDIMRDGQLMNLVIPRGPLGVRLDTARIDPDS